MSHSELALDFLKATVFPLFKNGNIKKCLGKQLNMKWEMLYRVGHKKDDSAVLFFRFVVLIIILRNNTAFVFETEDIQTNCFLKRNCYL